MNKIKKIFNKKSIILIAILTILIVLINYNKSNAFEYASLNNLISWGTVGDTLKIGFSSGNAQLETVNGSDPNSLYCIQHGQSMKNAATASPYGVIFKVRIEGNHAISSDTDSSGNPRTSDCQENGILAYIIGGGSDSYGYGKLNNNTRRQKELWHYWNTWVNASGRQLGIDWTYSGNDTSGVVSDLEEAAKTYARSSSGGARISSNVGDNIQTDNMKAGPFNVTYVGTLSTIVVRDINGEDITGSIAFMRDNNYINANQITSGQNFYIENKTGKTLKDITITVYGGGETINANLWLLKHSTDGYQRLLATQPDRSSTSQTQSVTINITTIQTPNTLRVVKYGVSEGEDNQKQTGVRFIIFKEGTGYLCKRSGEAVGKMTYDESNFYFEPNDRNRATIFKTSNTSDGWEGYFQITELPDGKYYVGEVYNPIAGYENSEIVNCNLETWKGESLQNKTTLSNINHGENISGYSNALQVVSTTLENGYTKIFRIYDGKDSDKEKGTITINKESTSGESLRAGFIIYSEREEGFIARNNEGYTADNDDARVFRTDNNGTRVISNLENDTYYIFEVEAPEGYELSEQDGYREKPNGPSIRFTSGTEWVYCGKVVINGNRAYKSVTYTNKSDDGGGGGRRHRRNTDTYGAISGYVWIDKSNTKNGETNNLYDNGEQLVAGVTVRLKNKSGSVVDTTTTDSNGAYKFNNVPGDVSEYYVEFNYSGTEYAEYALVTPNYNASNGSKVTAGDSDGIAVTYTGTNSTIEAKYGLTKFYNSSTETAENVNMGLLEVPDPGYSISETISYVEMTMNGYTYKYTYGGQGKVLATVPTVNWQGAQAYTRNIYPSDIIYNIEHRTEALKINVVYRIDITNTENTNERYRYMEKDLQITDLINAYDHDRYTLSDDNWTETSGNAKINSSYLSEVNGSGLKPNETATAYIKFKVNEKAIEEVLTNPAGITENKNIPTKATSHAYHNYERYVTYINSSTGEQEEKLKSYKTSDKPKSAEAYYLLFKLPNNPRAISGNIFEDIDEKDAEVLGNGKYENDKEGKISKVKVELLLSDKTTLSKLYKRSESGGTVYENGSLPDAIIDQTGEDGTYKFEGVVPGDYYLRFTYGNGTQVIKQVNGNTENVYSSAYKSTIVTSGVTKTALETTYEATKALWYLDLEDKNYSIAVDNIEKRKEISNTNIDFASVNNDYKTPSTAPEIFAETAMISVPIEYTKTSEGIGTTDYPCEFTGMNFGIIKMPEIDLKIDKEITNVKLTLSNLQVLFDGNPTSDMNYVASLDSNPNQAGGSGYVRAELDSNYIYGSTLLLTYGIKVTNNSDLTYVENESDGKYGWYYKYGETTYAHEAQINVTDVLDYLDPLLTKISSDDTNLEEILVNSLSDTDSFKKALLHLKEKRGIDTDFKKLYNFKSFGSLTTSKGSNANASSKILNLNASKLLSTDDDDLEFINYAQIVKASDEKLTYKDPSPISDADTLLEQIGALQMTDDSAKITITPPTGNNKSNINYIVLAIELVVLTTGIVIIKKKVIK